MLEQFALPGHQFAGVLVPIMSQVGQHAATGNQRGINAQGSGVRIAVLL
jgi:hypothetical protein